MYFIKTSLGQPLFTELQLHSTYDYRMCWLSLIHIFFEKETYRLLGAQIIGYEGVDKRIDVLATAIHAGLKATQLKDLDLAYAPPYSSAKDPVNMAGFMIDNIAKGTLKQWHLEDVDTISEDESAVLLDVRTVNEFSRGHIDGFKNIPVDELRERINEIEKGKPVYLICQSCLLYTSILRSQKGIAEMCGTIQEIIDRERYDADIKARMDVAPNLWSEGENALDKISRTTKLSIEQVKRVITAT